MILSGQSIRKLCKQKRYRYQTKPWVHSGDEWNISLADSERIEEDNPDAMLVPFSERGVQNGRSYGLSVAGYDIRIKDGLRLYPGEFQLASSVERFKMPTDILGLVKDKSSWARQGISVFNTVIEPGWEGWLTLELVNNSKNEVLIKDGDPIAQVIFQKLDHPAEKPYEGKYHMQEDRPVEARFE
jgi:dCTP deaminase